MSKLYLCKRCGNVTLPKMYSGYCFECAKKLNIARPEIWRGKYKEVKKR